MRISEALKNASKTEARETQLPKKPPTPSETAQSKTDSKNNDKKVDGSKLMQILKTTGTVLAVGALLWFGYYEWKAWTAREELQKIAAAKEAREHPPMWVDTLRLSKEWSEWIKPDSLFRPNNTHAGWMWPGDVALEIEDARGKIFKEGPHSHKRVNYAINQDSLRFRTPKRDSTWFILTLTPIQ